MSNQGCGHNFEVYDTRRIRLEDVTAPNYIPMFGGRPNREEVISDDDVTDLIIALENGELDGD